MIKSLRTLFVLLTVFIGSNVVGQDLIINGSFENTPRIKNRKWRSFHKIEGWQSDEFNVLIPFELKSYKSGGINASHGNIKLELDAKENSAIEQTVQTIIGEKYTLSLDYTPRVRWSFFRRRRRDTNVVEVFIDGKKALSLNNKRVRWRKYKVDFVATKMNTVIELRAAGRSDGKGGLVDNLKLVTGNSANLLENPSFEETPDDSFKDYGHFFAKSRIFRFLRFWKRYFIYRGENKSFYNIAGWSASKEKTIKPPFEIQYKKAGGISAQEGVKKLELDAKTNSKVSQNVSTKENGFYELSFYYSPRTRHENSNKVKVYWNDELIDVLNGSYRGWVNYKYELLATSKNSKLSFKGAGKADKVGGLIDNVSLTLKKPNDSTAPVVEVANDPIFPQNQNNFYFQVNVSDDNDTETKIFINDVLALTTESKEFEYTAVLPEGQSIIKVVSTDEYGNVSEEKLIEGLFVDSLKPQILSLLPATNTKLTTRSFNWQIKANEPFKRVRINNQWYETDRSDSFLLPFNAVNDGVTNYSIYIVDLYENQSSISNVSIGIDSTKPTLNAYPKDLILGLDNSYLFDVMSDDANFLKVEIFRDNTLLSTHSEKNFTKAINLINGVNNLVFKATDTYGNVTSVAKTVNTNQFPKASLVLNTTRGELPLKVEFDGSGSSDDNGIVSYYFVYDENNSDFGTNAKRSFTFYTEGTYNVSLLVRDSSGYGSRVSSQIEVLPSTNLPPKADGLFAFILSEGEPFGVEMGVYGHSDPDGEIVKYRFNYGDGSEPFEILASESDDGYHTRDFTGGTYNIVVELIDDKGRIGVVEKEITLQPTSLPVHNAIIDKTSGIAPLTVNFDLRNATDADGEIRSYQYDFRDGTPRIENDDNTPVSHTYTEPGTYYVQVRLYDTNNAFKDEYYEINVFDENDIFPDTSIGYGIRVGGSVPTVEMYLNGNVELLNDQVKHFEWDFGDGTQKIVPYATDETENSYLQHTFTTIGTFNVSCIIVSEGGKRSEPITRTIELDGTERPIPIFEVDKIRGTSPLTINANALKAFDIDGEITRYRWTMGDGAKYDGTSFKEISHTFTESGVYRVELRTYDDKRAQRYARFYVYVDQPNDVVGQPPIALINVQDRLGEAPFLISFKGEFSFDPDSDIPLTYEWNFNDYQSPSNISYEANPTHQFTNPGLYFVELTVTDNDGNQASEDVPVFVYDEQSFNGESFELEQIGERQYKISLGDSIPSKYPIDPASITWSTGDGGNYFRDSSFEHEYSVHGEYDIKLEFRDLRGDYSQISRSINTNLDLSETPEAIFDCSYVHRGDLNCYYSNSIGSENIVNYEWRVNNEVVGSNEPYFLLLMQTEGMYEVTLKITTNNGYESEKTQTVFKRDNNAPIADFNCTSKSNKNLSCTSNFFDQDGDFISYYFIVDGERINSNSFQDRVFEEEKEAIQVSFIVSDGLLNTQVDKEVNLSTNNEPFVAIDCRTPGPLRIECNSSSVDSDGDPLTFEWRINGNLISTERNFNINNLSAGSISVELVVSDGLFFKSMARVYTIKDIDILPPEIDIICAWTKYGILACDSKNSESPTGAKFVEYRWEINDELVSSEKSFSKQYITTAPVNIKLKVIDSNDFASSGLMTMAPQNKNVFAKITCSNSFNNSIDCDSSRSLVDGEVEDLTYEWTVNGSLVTTDASLSFNGTVGQNYEITLTLRLGNLVSTDQFLIKLDEEETNISSGSLKLLTDIDSFLPLNTSFNFQIENALIDTSFEVSNILSVYINDDYITPESINVTSDSLGFNILLADGKNDVRISLIDDKGKVLETGFNVYAGSKELNVLINTDQEAKLKLYDLRSNNILIDQIVFNGQFTIANVPSLDYVVLVEGVNNTKSELIEKNFNEILNVDLQDQSEIINTNNWDFSRGVEGWKLSYGFVTNFLNRVSISSSPNGLIKLSTRLPVNINRSITMPYLLRSIGNNVKGFLRISDIGNQKTNLVTLSDSNSRNERLVLNEVSLKADTNSKHVDVEIFLKEDIEDESSVNTDSFISNIISNAFAQSFFPENIIELSSITNREINFSNAILLDNQQHSIGKRLRNFPVGQFPSAYKYNGSYYVNPYNIGNTLNSNNYVKSSGDVFSAMLEVDVADETINYQEQDIVMQVCIGNNYFCKSNLADFCSQAGKKLRCTFNFSESFIEDYQVYTSDIRLSVASYQSTTRTSNYEKIYSSRDGGSFRAIISLSAAGIIGGLDGSEDRYGARGGGDNTDIADGTDDWISRNHAFMTDLPISIRSNYVLGFHPGIESINSKVDDISSLGFSELSGLGHSAHNDGIEIDIRFAKLTELKNSQIVSESSADISKYYQDGVALSRLANSIAVDKLLVTSSFISAFNSEYNTLLRVENTSFDSFFSNPTIGINPFAEGLLACDGTSYSPIGIVRFDNGHSNHAHIKLFDSNEEGIPQVFDPNPETYDMQMPQVAVSNLIDIQTGDEGTDVYYRLTDSFFNELKRLKVSRFLVFYQYRSIDNDNSDDAERWRLMPTVENLSNMSGVSSTDLAYFSNNRIYLNRNARDYFELSYDDQNSRLREIRVRFVFLKSIEHKGRIRNLCSSSVTGIEYELNCGENEFWNGKKCVSNTDCITGENRFVTSEGKCIYCYSNKLLEDRTDCDYSEYGLEMDAYVTGTNYSYYRCEGGMLGNKTYYSNCSINVSCRTGAKIDVNISETQYHQETYSGSRPKLFSPQVGTFECSWHRGDGVPEVVNIKGPYQVNVTCKWPTIYPENSYETVQTVQCPTEAIWP